MKSAVTNQGQRGEAAETARVSLSWTIIAYEWEMGAEESPFGRLLFFRCLPHVGVMRTSRVLERTVRDRHMCHIPCADSGVLDRGGTSVGQ